MSKSKSHVDSNFNLPQDPIQQEGDNSTQAVDRRHNRINIDNLTMLIEADNGVSAAKLLEGFTVSELAILCDGAEAAKDLLAKAVELLDNEKERRFAQSAKEARQVDGKDYGTIRIYVEHGWEVVCEIAKKVDWVQDKLKTLRERIVSFGDDPEEYMTVELKISEKKFDTWLPEVKAMFLPARTVRLGKQKFKLVKKA